MHTWPNYTFIQAEFSGFKRKLAKIQAAEPRNVEEFRALDTQLETWKRDLAKFFKKHFPSDAAEKLDKAIYGDRDKFWWRSYLELDAKVKLVKDMAESVSEIFENIEQLLLASDMLKESGLPILNRGDFTVQQKKDLLLDKLYFLRKSKKFWNAEMIFALNDIGMDSESEAKQVVQALVKAGYIESESSSSSSVSKVRITVKGKSHVEKGTGPKPSEPFSITSHSMDVFISHSSQDADCAKALIELLHLALNIPAKRIRCSSVEGYRLPAGVSTDQQLKSEVNDCKVLIGLISPNSINSAYVLFELGARWGQSKPLIPLVTSKKGAELLKGPLSGINALNASIHAQVHQLVSDLSTMLNLQAASASVYLDKVDKLVELSLK